MQIRRAEMKDIPAISIVLSETWRDTYGHMLPPEAIEAITSTWHAPQRLAREVESDSTYFAVAQDEEAGIVGLITAAQHGDLEIVGRLYVHPSYQRCGIGQQLLEASYRAFPDARKVRLDVEEKNTVGVSFYLKQGFEEVERRKLEEMMGVELETMVMERSLYPPTLC